GARTGRPGLAAPRTRRGPIRRAARHLAGRGRAGAAVPCRSLQRLGPTRGTPPRGPLDLGRPSGFPLPVAGRPARSAGSAAAAVSRGRLGVDAAAGGAPVRGRLGPPRPGPAIAPAPDL